MGQMDTFTKEYLRRDRVFADLVNMALFHGKARISPGNLQEVDTTSEAIVISFDTQRSSNITLIRDIIKKVTWNTDYGQFIYVGIENQTAIDYAMPLRVSASSDLFWFRDMRVMQGKLRENRHVRDLLTSVPKGTTIPMMVAIVLYWGETPWDAPNTLLDMHAPFPPELKALIPSYPYIIIQPRALSQRNVNLLQTDLKCIFQCMRLSNDPKALNNLVTRSPRFKKIDALAALIINERLNLHLRINKTQREGDINMCQAWKELLAEERDKGAKSMEPILKLLQTENESIKSANESMKAENASVKTKLVFVEAENESIKAENESVKAENESVKAENESVKTKLVFVEAENKSVKAENESVKAENESVKAENESAKQKLRDQGWSEESIRELFSKKE